MDKRLLLAPLLTVLTLVLLACNRPAPSPTVEPGAGAVFTAAAQTVEAELTAVAEGRLPSATPVPIIPTSGSTAVAPPTQALEPTEPAGGESCDRANFVEDVTVPDGTQMQPGQSFDKTWRLRNAGTCTWNSGYSLVFESGDAMGGPAAMVLTTGTVGPGDEIEVTVALVAPEDSGTYRGDWLLRNGAGQSFGVGAAADDTFWVEIDVAGPTPTPSPDFSLTFSNIHDCSGLTTVSLQVENSGNTTFESAAVSLIDLDDNNNVLYGPLESDTPFTLEPDACATGGNRLEPGRIRYLIAQPGTMPAAGHTIRARINLCPQNGLGGACREKTTDFPAP